MATLGPSSTIPEDARGAAIALGNFDGVHRGHQAVIASARDVAERTGAPLGVAVFEPHPRRFFQPDTPPFRLQSPAQRARALAELGVEEVFEIGFDQSLAQSTDREFAERLLRDCLGASHVSVGAEFRFGRGRMGDAESLRRLGEEFGFTVAAVSPVGGKRKISSSSVRQAIAAGDMKQAMDLLGRPWAIEGEVLRGFGRGREFGFPTANVALGDYVQPRLGIYAARVHLGDGILLPAVASVGVNPTVGALPAPLLETHLFDFSGDLYGKTIEVELIALLREEAKFESIDALKAQMKDDVIAARRALVGV
ncbi:MAG TPA: bifunctional riboflavin kinase/FAD synthetase [Vitreimonas sp.]|uniref:bifunctional riboflavin kinase/FAD synthetase n=1 Tax=Vitreimonas sp. TaxID=3069702 RepID=UPI002D6B7A03|nr:bifunctional riboflavin kinase/FAD synthetase [Vitreimonas sp.]HYD87199.1 bifunctional riboflavin kinase/FAD synthetase [Vitreimonas sp.]